MKSVANRKSILSQGDERWKDVVQELEKELRQMMLIHSFIPDISIAPLQVHYYSEVLSTTALILCQSSHAEAPEATMS